MTVDISYSMFESEAPFGVLVADMEFLCPGTWADCRDNAEAAVNGICEAFFTDEEWDRKFGADETSASVLVEIAAPHSIKGTYTVELTRVIKARASECDDPRVSA